MFERVRVWIERNRIVVGFVVMVAVTIISAWLFAWGLSAGVEGDICAQAVSVYV